MIHDKPDVLMSGDETWDLIGEKLMSTGIVAFNYAIDDVTMYPIVVGLQGDVMRLTNHLNRFYPGMRTAMMVSILGYGSSWLFPPDNYSQSYVEEKMGLSPYAAKVILELVQQLQLRVLKTLKENRQKTN